MKKRFFDFVVTVVAVFVALFVYDKLHGTRAGSDLRSGAVEDRGRMLQSDFHRAADRAQTAMAEYYANHHAWPAKNEDLGLPPPDSYTGESLRRMEIMGPAINLTFDAKSGVDGARITLNALPTRDMAMGINWDCISNIADIAMILPTCKYTKPYSG
jgi:hypothetical protein